MRRVIAPFGRRAGLVTAREELGAYVVLRCEDPDGPRPQAGQFYMLSAGSRWGGGRQGRPFLPRAFSVLRAPARSDELQFLIEDVGPGTKRLCELREGEELLLVGPLGHGFDCPRDRRRPLLVGGGVGIAPLVIWQDVQSAGADCTGGIARGAIPPAGSDCEDVQSAGADCTGGIARGAIPPAGSDCVALLGFRDAAHAPGAALLTAPRTATDDGSVGHHGLVTDLLRTELEADDAVEIYACGPPPMLEAVRRIAAERDVPAQLALESGMACGFGACFGCVVPTRSGYVRLCLDGPVLDAASLDTALVAGAWH